MILIFSILPPSYKIAGDSFNWYYYLADGIYPAWKIFLQTLSDAAFEKEKCYVKAQEGVRKCVERIFGVPFRRFKILFVASELWDPEKMEMIAKCCVILHNMIVEQRRDTYTSDGGRGLSRHYSEENDETDLRVVHVETDNHEQRLNMMAPACADIRSLSEYMRLRTAIIDHQWARRGNEASS